MQDRDPTTWQCLLCSKCNPTAKTACSCCGRDRQTYFPKAITDASTVAPYPMHGNATLVHAFHPDQITAMVKAGLDLDKTDEDGWTAMHCAAHLGQPKVVKALLNQKTSLMEAESAGGWKPLHIAAAKGHVSVVEELLLGGAEVDVRMANAEALTPLHLAAFNGHSLVIELLLLCDADPLQTTCGSKRSCLHLAVINEHVDCVRLLLAVRKELATVCDANGLYPYHNAQLLSPLSSTKNELLSLLHPDHCGGKYASLPDRLLV